MATAPWRSVAAVKREFFLGTKKDLGTKFPEVKDSVAALDIEDAIIDGEIVALDDKGRSSFQLLQAGPCKRSGKGHPFCVGRLRTAHARIGENASGDGGSRFRRGT
jgi:hypothetical protein